MLGVTPWLFRRPLVCRYTTRVLRTVVTPNTRGSLQYGPFRTAGSAGYSSKIAGDNDSGHIEAGENEGMFFVDSKFHKGIELFSLRWRLKYCRYIPSKILLSHMAPLH